MGSLQARKTKPNQNQKTIPTDDEPVNLEITKYVRK